MHSEFVTFRALILFQLGHFDMINSHYIKTITNLIKVCMWFDDHGRFVDVDPDQLVVVGCRRVLDGLCADGHDVGTHIDARTTHEHVLTTEHRVLNYTLYTWLALHKLCTLSYED